MNANEIVGVEYVGKKPVQEDTVCRTGAVWKPGQVHNFGSALAAALLVHTDSFARAPLSPDGGTFLTMGKGRALNKQHDVAAFVNLNAMDVGQMVHFARRELDRVVSTDGKDEGQIRREVLSLMTNHSLDLEADRKLAEQSGDARTMVPFMATAEEYAALMAGTVKLMLVPTEILLPGIGDKSADADGSDTAASQGSADASAQQAAPRLDELLATLDKPQLMDFARQEGVTFSNNATAERLREKIFTELSAREVKKAA